MSDRFRFALIGTVIFSVALLSAGCPSVPDPVEPTPPPHPQVEPTPDPDPERKPEEVKLVVKKDAPVVNLHVPVTSRNPAIEEYPVVLEVRAEKDGASETADVQLLFEQDLLDQGLTLAAPGEMGHAEARVMVLLNLKAWKVMDLGAGRTQVHGDGSVAVDRKSDRLPLYRAPLAAKSGANLTEVRATRQVLESMCTDAAAHVHKTVSEYAILTHVKVVSIDTESESVSIDAFGDAIEAAIRDEDGVVLVARERAGSGKAAKFVLWLAPDYEGDLAGLLGKKLEKSGTDNRTEVDINLEN